MTPDQQIQLIIDWFGLHFEDPVQQTPYNSREGGYLWIHGGPYDADEEIQSEFSSVASLDVMRSAVDEITADGTLEWAGVNDGSDYTDEDHDLMIRVGEDDLTQPADRSATFAGHSFAGHSFAMDDAVGQQNVLVTDQADSLVTDSSDRIVFDSVSSRASGAALRIELDARVERLGTALRNVETHLPPRNHNHPPELVEPEPVAEADLKIVHEVVVELKADLQDENPNPVKLEVKASL
jgi:hypothetical protein